MRICVFVCIMCVCVNYMYVCVCVYYVCVCVNYMYVFYVFMSDWCVFMSCIPMLLRSLVKSYGFSNGFPKLTLHYIFRI